MLNFLYPVVPGQVSVRVRLYKPMLLIEIYPFFVPLDYSVYFNTDLLVYEGY